MSVDYDVILVGGGLANGLIALQLRQRQPALRVLVIEQGPRAGGNHTWSFHDGDLSAAQHRWLAPLVGRRWDHHQVRFPAFERTLSGGYSSIFSTDFHAGLAATLGDALWLDTAVATLSPSRVQLANGRELRARAVLDGRGPQDSPHLALGYQAFLGQELRLERPHGLEAPIIMDATVDQGEGYRFVYVLPFTAERLLIEDTHYVDRARQDPARLRAHIAAYAAARGWTVAECLREESGTLPIVLAGDFRGFWDANAGQPVSGLRAGLFHATTGYSLPQALRLAEHIAGLERFDAASVFVAIHRQARREWRAQGYFRLLNRMLFLAGPPSRRWQVMQRFYGLPEGLIERFYAGRLRATDKLRIVAGKPPVPLGEAFRAAGRFSVQRIGTRS